MAGCDAAIIIPTRDRAGYLDVALASTAPQAAEHGADLVVVLDGPDPASRAVAERHGARVLEHDVPRGLNAARNTAIESTSAGLLCFVDDDVAVRPGWLGALCGAHASLGAEYGLLTGPIHARIEDHRFRVCGREGPPVTALDLGPADVDAPHAWGANLAVRRSAVALVGPFDAAHQLYGDEQEWQDRLRAAGLRIRYVAAAALDHRRAGDDARLSSLVRAARRRGRAARREDVGKGTVPPLRGELRTLVATAVHGPRLLCMNGPVMAAHQLGRVEEALSPTVPRSTPGVDDFLSGRSGTVAGWRSAWAGLQDAVLDVAVRVRPGPSARRRRVLVVGVERPGSLFQKATDELRNSNAEVTIEATGLAGRGKFENLNRLLAAHDLTRFDWVLVLDDDVTLPRGFLDRFLALAEREGYELVQPAHRRRSHAAWEHTRRRGRGARPTTFVEIGPVTAFGGRAKDELLPFPEDVGMGWGLDAHWSARGYAMGIVDATPIGHLQAPAGDAYSREQAVTAARAFLDGKPYVTREQAR